MDIFGERKTLAPAGNLTSYCPACNLITILTMQSCPQNYYMTESNKIPLIPYH